MIDTEICPVFSAITEYHGEVSVEYRGNRLEIKERENG